MGIDWKARFRNKALWVYIASAILTTTQLLGVKIFPDNFADIVNSILGVLVFMGILVDNSTPGTGDSKEGTK